MQTIVTAYGNSKCTKNFLRLQQLFYPVPIVVDTARCDESKSAQLQRICKKLKDEYFILLEDDFYFTSPVDRDLLFWIELFCMEEVVDRFSLQSKNAYSFTDWTKTDKIIDGCIVHQANEQVKIPFSLEASIWRREFLLEHLESGWTDAQIELNGSEKIQSLNTKIYALDKIVMLYQDAVRDGRQVIDLLENPLRLLGTMLLHLE